MLAKLLKVFLILVVVYAAFVLVRRLTPKQSVTTTITPQETEPDYGYDEPTMPTWQRNLLEQPPLPPVDNGPQDRMSSTGIYVPTDEIAVAEAERRNFRQNPQEIRHDLLQLTGSP
jgi:uncharacterized membrane protein